MAPIIGVPTRPPRVATVDIAAYNRPEKAGLTPAARNDRRVMLALDPSMVIANPATRAHTLGAKATRNDPAESRNTLHLDNVRSLVAVPNFHFRDRAVLTAGIIARYSNKDMTPLIENRSPA